MKKIAIKDLQKFILITTKKDEKEKAIVEIACLGRKKLMFIK